MLAFLGLAVYFGLLLKQAYKAEKITVVSRDYFRNTVMDSTEIDINIDNFDFGMRVVSLIPLLEKDDKIEQYFSIEGVLEETRWNTNFTPGSELTFKNFTWLSFEKC